MLYAHSGLSKPKGDCNGITAVVFGGSGCMLVDVFGGEAGGAQARGRLLQVRPSATERSPAESCAPGALAAGFTGNTINSATAPGDLRPQSAWPELL